MPRASGGPSPTKDVFSIGDSNRNRNEGFVVASFHGRRLHDRGTRAERSQSIAAAPHVFADADLTDVDAELEQLTVDPWCTPTGILSAHLADQLSDLTGNDRSSRLAVPHLPGPEKTALPVLVGNSNPVRLPMNATKEPLRYPTAADTLRSRRDRDRRDEPRIRQSSHSHQSSTRHSVGQTNGERRRQEIVRRRGERRQGIARSRLPGCVLEVVVTCFDAGQRKKVLKLIPANQGGKRNGETYSANCTALLSKARR
jgi:hypothetical protein